MNESDPMSPLDLRPGLTKIRRRRWFLWLLIIAYLPAMMLALRAEDSGTAVVTSFCIWLLLLIVSVALLTLVRCPKCGNCFHMSGYSFRPVRRCFHCGLHLNADKQKSKAQTNKV